MNKNLAFPKLLSPLKLGLDGHQVELKNRVIMGSMHTGLEDSLWSLEDLTQFYEERARGGVGLIVTGGFAPNRRGWLVPFTGKLTHSGEVWRHKKMTQRVQAAGAKIFLQILHAGRYSYHPFLVAPSSLKSPISKFSPREMTARQIEQTVADFARCAVLAERAGYDGVEIMGSEGYLINQFLVSKTNHRQDEWGGSLLKRRRFAEAIVSETRRRVSPSFLLMFRISLLDLVEEGNSLIETFSLAAALEKCGVNLFNSGIGWHEARVPTIATSVPRGAFVEVTSMLRQKVSVPVVAVNRINTPELAEQILREEKADLISMARPLLADAEFVNKAASGESQKINTCIACNQACLDHIFVGKKATCLVNPRAAREKLWPVVATSKSKQIFIIGAGPAGLSAAVAAAERGHQVTLFDQAPQIGGQFNLARRIPGKFEFQETLRYFKVRLQALKVEVNLGVRVSANDLLASSADELVIATGTRPRKLAIPGIEHKKVLSYHEALEPERRALLGQRIAIVGAGGIGFDVAEYLLHQGEESSSEFLARWGVSLNPELAGGLVLNKQKKVLKMEVYLLQRKQGKLGASLGKTTGWIHRASLVEAGVKMLDQVEYKKIDDQGLHIERRGQKSCLEVDHVIICAGQETQDELVTESVKQRFHRRLTIIGGAQMASELDAKRAIEQGTFWGLKI